MFHPSTENALSAAADGASPTDTLASLFVAQCEKQAGKPAYLYLKDDLAVAQESSYERLLADVSGLAHWLANHTHAGDRVLLAFMPATTGVPPHTAEACA